MDSRTSLEINTHGSCRAPSYDLDDTFTVDNIHDSTTGFGNVDTISGDNSKSARYEDCELFDSREMERFLTDLVKPNHGRSSSTCSSTFRGHQFCSTPPLLAKKGTMATSGTDSPLPEVHMDIPGERRRAQNRAAQRAHRERQKRYVAQLEKRFFALQANYNRLDEKYKTVQKQYDSLASFMQSQQTPMDSPVLRDSTEVVLEFSSVELPPLNEFSWCEQELDRVLAFRVDETPSPELRGSKE